MNYLLMDRASEAAANDLAEVRKLIEGMNALVNSQLQQQQSQQQQQQQLIEHTEYPTTTDLHLQQQHDALIATLAATVAQQTNLLAQQSTPTAPLTNTDIAVPDTNLNPVSEQTSLQSPPQTNTETTHTTDSTTTVAVASNTAATENVAKPTQDTQTTTQQQAETQMYSSRAPQAGVIIEVTHLSYNRTLYFQLAQDATIEPMIAWLRLSFGDSAISGMVLQYKGFDGLWKCLLNRDDSLRRMLKQSTKGNTMLQMRVPREQDLLSSGYTDRRLLALTKSDSL